MEPNGEHEKELKRAGDDGPGRRTAGCLIAVLAPAVLVTLFFLALGLFSLVLAVFKIGHPDPAMGESRGSSLFAGIAITLFSLPLAIVLGRALYGAVLFAVKGRRIPLVTWKTVLPASLLLGLPALVIAGLGLFGVIQIDLKWIPFALVGALLLLGGPFVLRRMQGARDRTSHGG